jgi:hypothetical protein
MIYTGPDQRKEPRAIVLGMACPHCSGPVHNPGITAAERLVLTAPYFDSLFACMNEECGWEAPYRRFDPESLLPPKKVKR